MEQRRTPAGTVSIAYICTGMSPSWLGSGQAGRPMSIGAGEGRASAFPAEAHLGAVTAPSEALLAPERGQAFPALGTCWAGPERKFSPPSSRAVLRLGSGLALWGAEGCRPWRPDGYDFGLEFSPFFLLVTGSALFRETGPRDPEPQPKPLGPWEQLGSIYLFICSFVPYPYRAPGRGPTLSSL